VGRSYADGPSHDLSEERDSKILGGVTAGLRGGRAVAVAVVSSIVFFGGIALLVVNSAGWPEFKQAFFDRKIFTGSFGEIASAFLVNVKIFSIAEVVILCTALGVAVLRGLPSPVFFPLRVLAVVYADFFRGVPTILLVYLLGFGIPALQLSGVPTSELFWGTVALILVYTAYVSEVYRAGIESVHPSQNAAARSLGLSHGQSLRYVVIPQAVRRVIPPLLNDFIGLQKDTALVGVLGVVEAFRQTQIDQASTFNFTPGIVAAVLFLLITVPMTRFTDWLIARDRRRRQAAGLAA
jgi:polar amino acid transport system permease protein